MLTQFSVCLLATILGQAPSDQAWLKVIPADIDVVVRGNSLEATRTDLVAMLKAMSPQRAVAAETSLANQISQLETQYGALAVRSPFVGIVRVVLGAEGQAPPFAVLVLNDDYPGVLKAISGDKAPALKHLEGGVDSFDSPQGQGSLYATKGAGFVAFGPDKPLIASIAKPTGKTLDTALTPAAAKPLFAGDLGIYINVAALATRYADQIDGARQALLAAIDQAGERGGNPTSLESVKGLYSNLFDSLKYADALTLDLDVAAKGFHLAGAVKVKADTSAAKNIAASKAGTGEELAQLAADSAYIIYMNMSAETIDRLMTTSLRLITPSGKPTPALEEARAKLREIGRIETVGGVTFDKGMNMVSLSRVANPKKYVEAIQALSLSMKGNKDGGSYIKDIKVESNVATYRGFTFSHVSTTLDFDKLANLGPQSGATIASLKSLYDGDVQNNWYGTDATRVLQVMAPKWEDAKAQIDSFLDSKTDIGVTPAYKAIRSELPERNNLLSLVSIQGVAKMMAKQLAATANKPPFSLPADMPKEPALFGVSLTPLPPAVYEFHLVLPSTVGPVIEKGLIPLFQNLQAPAAQ